MRIFVRPGPLTNTVGSSAYLSTMSWPPYTIARSAAADELVGSRVVSGQEHHILIAKPALAQGVNQPVPGERLAS